MRSLVRTHEIEQAIRGAGGTEAGQLAFTVADLLRDEGWAEALSGAAYVMHTASPFPASLPREEADLIEPARNGTLRVLKAARAAAVRRVVLTSSVAAVIYGDGIAPFTEENWSDPGSPLSTPYYRSKTLAERAAWDFARESGLELAVINPGMILGPLLGGDVGTSVGVVRNLLRGKYPALPKYSIPVADVRDVADAHLSAMTVAEAAGERFLIGGAAMSLAEISAVLRRDFPAYAGKLPRFILPNWLAAIAARFDPGLRLIVRELGRDSAISNAKARRILGWVPRSEEAAIKASAESLIAAGLV
ncbi:NAD-dependent epimerase/dehydratase family protein [Ensifer sp.]|uniref:NAD-dependent epimerase/dehydratase family protein n=1 Tax=Ensifer sp. TaxID=1872086 RepID=UPI002E1418FC|nr:NAD-dependent epimerase/dehydratase family protein [Ensifer sp.]